VIGGERPPSVCACAPAPTPPPIDPPPMLADILSGTAVPLIIGLMNSKHAHSPLSAHRCMHTYGLLLRMATSSFNPPEVRKT
jgi:hypothetical protein